MSGYLSYVSLTADLDDFEAMLDKNATLSGANFWATDLDLLLTAAEGHFEDVMWTAPKDFPAGSVILVYHTATARDRARALANRAVREAGGRLLAEARHAAQLAHAYAGTVFAVARTTEDSEPEGDGRYTAPLERVHIFPEPLPKAAFEDVATITTGSGRRLDGQQLEEIRHRLSRKNELPDFLARA